MNVPAGYTALDLVGFTDRGPYDPDAYYVQNDITHYGGNMFLCLIDDTHNITPVEGANWTLWIGEPTNMTEAIIAPLEVSPATAAHVVGDQLIYNDVLYKVVSAITIGDVLTVGTNIEAARKIVYQISGIESDIATIEPTSTASKNYAVGEYMFFSWEFYRVTTAITAGDTIITTGAGQNVTEVTVGNELTSLNSRVSAKTENTVVSTQAVETIGANAIEAHSLRSFFLATDGKYYKVTSAISAGAPITLGTNCEQTSIAEEQRKSTFESIRANLFVGIGGISPNGGHITFTFSGTFRGVLFGFHHSTSAEDFAIVIGGGSSSASYKALSDLGNIAVTINSNKITITNNNTAGTSTLRLLVIDGEMDYTVS